MDAPGITIRSSGSVLPLDAGRAQTREPESGCRPAGGRERGHGRGNRTRVSECSGRSAAVERAGSKNQIKKTLTGGPPPAVVYFIRLSDAPEAAGERAEIVFVEYLEKVHDALPLIGRPGHEEVFSCSRK